MRRACLLRLSTYLNRLARRRPEPLIPSSSQVHLSPPLTSLSSSHTSFTTAKTFNTCKQWRNLITCCTLSSSLSKSPVKRWYGSNAIRLTVNSLSTDCSGVKDAVLAKWASLSEKKVASFAPKCLQDVLNFPHLLPEATRHLWRVSRLSPEEVLNVLIDFESSGRSGGVEGKDVEFCWKLFDWASGQGLGFLHLPQSYRVMVSMLVWDGRVMEVETLLQIMENFGIKVENGEVFGKLIQWYIEANELENSVSAYDRAKSEGLSLSESCYLALLNYLARVKEVELGQRIFVDAVDVGWKLCAEKHHCFAVRALCKGRMVHEARKLFGKIVGLGVEPDKSVLAAIVDGYCENRDYDDILKCLKEWEFMPDVSLCNKIIASQCKSFGTDKAWQFVQQLEMLGFVPNAITFAILVGWSCKGGKLKEGFLHLSESVSRKLKADVQAYHSLIGGLFVKGMGKHAKEVLKEMYDKGVIPLASTYKVLVAGYCKNRQFNDAKQMVSEMVKSGFVSLLPTEDFLSKAFEISGLSHLNVKIKRDNSENLVRAEFFDSLGNGLYLETNIDLFDKALGDILSDSMVPNLNLLLAEECKNGNAKNALEIKNIMLQWDQKMSISSYSVLLETLSSSVISADIVGDLVSEILDMRNELHEGILNLLIQASIDRKLMHDIRHIMDAMQRRELNVEKSLFVPLILGFCEQRDKAEVEKYINRAVLNGWLPTSKEWKAIVHQLCKLGMIVEVLEFFEFLNMIHCDIDVVCSYIARELCVLGLSSVGHLFISEINKRGLEMDDCTLDHLVLGLCKEQNFDKALEVFEWALKKKMPPSLRMFEDLIAHLCLSSELEKALSFKKIMSSRQLGVSSFVYHSLINGLARRGRIKDGIFLLLEMNVAGMVSNECCEALLRGICRGNHVMVLNNLFELLGFMIRTNIKLSMSFYGSLVKLMCKYGRFHEILNLKRLMLSNHVHPPIVVYNIVLLHLFRSQQVYFVMKLLDEMHGERLSLDHDSYNVLIQGYSKCRMSLKAVEAFDSMMNSNFKPSTRSYRIACTYYASNGLFTKAMLLSKSSELRGWTHCMTVTTIIIDFLLAQGKFIEAEEFFDQMLGKDIVFNGFCCDVLIKRFCHHARLNKATELLNMMLKKGILPSDLSYSSIICGLCLNCSLDQALDFHAEMVHKNLTPTTKCIEMLIHKLCNGGRTLEAESLLLSICRLGLTPHQSVFQLIIDQFLEHKNVNKASEILEVMRQKGYQADFKTQWSLISNLKKGDEEDSSNNMGFLSKLLSRCGFHMKEKKG